MSKNEYRSAAILLIMGAVLANAAFIGLGSVFNYPNILQEPAKQVFLKFSANQWSIIAWFLLLTLGAALIAPIAILISRLADVTFSRWIKWTGILAATVQVIGLLRWPLIVPTLVASGDIKTFQSLNFILGTVIGETFGYFLTALWTILVVRMKTPIAGKWFTWLGTLPAGLIFLGVFTPLGLPLADLANFVGYILWSLWLIVFGILLWRKSK